MQFSKKKLSFNLNFQFPFQSSIAFNYNPSIVLFQTFIASNLLRSFVLLLVYCLSQQNVSEFVLFSKLHIFNKTLRNYAAIFTSKKVCNLFLLNLSRFFQRIWKLFLLLVSLDFVLLAGMCSWCKKSLRLFFVYHHTHSAFFVEYVLNSKLNFYFFLGKHLLIFQLDLTSFWAILTSLTNSIKFSSNYLSANTHKVYKHIQVIESTAKWISL